MYHTTAKNFQPTGFLANTAACTLAKCTTDIHFCTRFCKWKIRRTEPNLYIGTIHFSYKKIKSLFQICERNVFINIHTFHLVKETMTSCTNCFIAIDPAGTNNADRQFPFFHFPYLYVAGMCT